MSRLSEIGDTKLFLFKYYFNLWSSYQQVVFGTAIPILGPGRGGRPLVGQAVAPPSSPGMSLAGRAIVKGEHSSE